MKCWLKTVAFHEFYVQIEAVHETLNQNRPETSVKSEENYWIRSDPTYFVEDLNWSFNNDFSHNSGHNDTTSHRYSESNNIDIIDDKREIFVQEFIKTEPSFIDESSDGQPSKTKFNVKRPKPSMTMTRSRKPKTSMKRNKCESKIYECATCQKVFFKRYCIIKHVKIHLPRTKTYQCAHCEYMCHNRNAVRKHMWIHMKEKSFECYLCKMSIESRKLMKEHMVSVHCNSDQFVQICCFCSKTYKTRKEVEEHENRTHRMERLKCNFCDKIFRSLAGLKGHVQRFHTNNFVKRPEKVPCPICKKILSSKSALMGHLKRHDVKRPFICDTCGDSFKFPTCLKIHQRIHTGEKRTDSIWLI